MSRNIMEAVESQLCTGCHMCKSICKVQAIDYRLDSEGFSYPTVDASLCVNCGKCRDMCHILQQPEGNAAIGQFAAKYIDEQIRSNSRSGGIFYAIAESIIVDGGIVYGVTMTDPTTICYERAETVDKIKLMQSSCYVQCILSDDTVRQLKSDLSYKKVVMFIGTPCQVAGIRKMFSEKAYPNLLLVDFICHGVPSQKLWSDYIRWFEKRNHCSVTDAVFRDKHSHSWESHVESLYDGIKRIYSRRYANLFCANQCLRPSCYKCKYATFHRCSDFTIGDYWGIDEIDSSFNDHKGVSFVQDRTKKAEQMWNNIVTKLQVLDTSIYVPSHYNLKRPTNRPQNRELFWRDYSRKGFGYVSVKYGGYGLLHRIKYYLIDGIS